MKKVGPLVLRAFEGRILNTHLALLPRFGGPGMYGDRVFEAVLEAGETESGVSIQPEAVAACPRVGCVTASRRSRPGK
jgi:folate-dependent phosphoribosylglycinamide formyltransferase PurN